MTLGDYDGMSPLVKVPLNFVCIWVKIGNIPPAFEEPDAIALIASTVNCFLELDHKPFRKGEIRVRFWHDVTKFILLTKVVQLATRVEAVISFFYENYVGRCTTCGLIYHVGADCDVATDVASLDWTSTGTSATFDFGFG